MERLKEILLLYWRQCVVLGICLLLLLAYGAHGMVKEDKPVMNQPAHQQKLSRQSTKPRSTKICVDVKGAVSRPDVYYLPKDARVKEAIDAAGGIKAEADMKQVNLAKQLQDQQVVYVPLPGEQLPGGMAVPSASTSNGGENKEKINLNSASKADLQKIDGVGDKKADKILEYRQQHGQFRSVDDLKNISGFGEKTIAKIKDQLAV